MSEPAPVFVGKLPDALRRFARGEADPLDEPLAPCDRGDLEARDFVEEWLEVLRPLAAAEAARDAAGALVLTGEDPDGRFTLRARAGAVVVAFRSPRLLAAQGEDGIRGALGEVVRLARELPGDGLVLEDARFEGRVVYAVYTPSPASPLGRAARRVVAWSDGALLLIALKARKERAADGA